MAPPEKGLILFVHGFGGHGARTWQRFPELIQKDPALAHFDTAVFNYPAYHWLRRPTRPLPRVQLVADALHTEITNRYTGYPIIALVAHSLGGLVARQYLIDRSLDNGLTPVSKLVLYGTPNDGTGLANLGKMISWRQPQIKQLCRKSELIATLNKMWTKLAVGDVVDVKYVVAGQDSVIAEDSARGLPGLRSDVAVIADADHRSLVKPRTREDLGYKVLKNFVLDNPPRPAPPTPAEMERLRVVGFDLDGTLLRGLTFSWTLVWEHLGFSQEHHRSGMRKYRLGEWTYEKWCDWAVSCYRAHRLTRAQLEALADQLAVTQNMREGIASLKRAGFTVALISGGIDVFLYRKIPDADELFDRVFINRLRFDPDGLINSVEPTAYDFAGKADALEAVARDAGCSLAQSVFVGDGFNDAEVSKRAALSIAYPPVHFEQSSISSYEVLHDDLMVVADIILSRT